MKSLSVKVGVILVIGLCIFTYTEVRGADWKYMGESKDGAYHYDATSVTRSSRNIVRVRIRLEYNDKGVIGMVREFGKDFENLKYTIGLDEINCPDKKMRNLTLTHYSKEGKIIFTGSSQGEWHYVPSGSFYNAVCK
jgi:hypothetical protein